MIEELLEVVASRWGAMGLGAVLLVTGPGRKVVRGAAKGVIKAGMTVSDATREFMAEMKEQSGDLIAEVRAERQEHAEHDVKHPRKRTRKTASAE